MEINTDFKYKLISASKKSYDLAKTIADAKLGEISIKGDYFAFAVTAKRYVGLRFKYVNIKVDDDILVVTSEKGNVYTFEKSNRKVKK